MSYILDALRRSQAERDRGQVPGLNAQPAPADIALRPPRARTGWWLGGGLVALVLAGLLLLALRPDRAVPVADGADAGAGTAATPLTAPATAGATAPRPAPVAAPTSVPPAAVVSATAIAPAQLPIVVSAPPVQPTPTAAPSRPPAPSATPMPSAQPGPLTPAPATPAPAGAEPRPIPLAQLTPEQRRDLPALAVSGSIWSESASSRFVILNGSIAREGELVAPGLTLERIGPKAAVLRWRDIRIELAL